VAHSLSAKKRVRQNAKRRTINRARKSMVKTQVKRTMRALEEGNAEKAQQELVALTRRVDQIASTSTLHKNTAARIKSRMAKKLNALKAKTAS
jgi:small subunit ribosomal protein S20